MVRAGTEQRRPGWRRTLLEARAMRAHRAAAAPTWVERRSSLVDLARERVRAGMYDRDPVMRVAIDGLIDRLLEDLDGRAAANGSN